ncbi:glycosyltransferase family 25 protein [Herbaspirillum sp. RTI4]|uniref:glycosyltransferase family 25 protein n=1 Tax=Herbaspirillum sp. RTI4 TaxID=3048640 RepID=UPI002AB52003|nr:glycosyltransferase family 25 protein [Herbaspirillum sp. RTI4]MDY7578868.1 glycosyltransferase family 25 protein [Herbaspirillum sp. RTI4]MEA9983011.1 glycosyltransferase family 25 protein [Herbaspirillum sp. RTI4]
MTNSSQGAFFLPVVVISLLESHDRRSYVGEQLSKFGVPFRFYDATRLETYPPQYDAVTRMKNHGNHMNLSEVGCYGSHYQTWQQLVDSEDEAWCILEDDVELSDRFAPVLMQVAALTQPYGFIRLYDYGGEGSWQIGRLPDGSVLKDHRKQPFGMQGYVIHREAAKTLLAYAERILYPIDDVLNRNWEHRIPMASISPDVLKHRNDLMGTTIGREKAKRNLRQKLIREFYMGRDSLNRRIYAWRRREKKTASDTAI